MLIILVPATSLVVFTTLAGFTVGASVTRDAVVEISACFILVLSSDVRLSVLVATETRVARKIVIGVASCAGYVVVAIEQEEPVVIEGRRLPARGGVALRAGSGQLRMKAVRRRHVAGRTVPARRWTQQGMRELNCDWSPVVAVTGTTILLTEFLVERRIDPPLVQAFERCPACGPNADVRHGVASNASIGRYAAEWRMADEAIARELGMRRHEGARTHHRAGISEGEYHNSNPVGYAIASLRRRSGCPSTDELQQLHRTGPGRADVAVYP